MGACNSSKNRFRKNMLMLFDRAIIFIHIKVLSSKDDNFSVICTLPYIVINKHINKRLFRYVSMINSNFFRSNWLLALIIIFKICLQVVNRRQLNYNASPHNPRKFIGPAICRYRRFYRKTKRFRSLRTLRCGGSEPEGSILIQFLWETNSTAREIRLRMGLYQVNFKFTLHFYNPGTYSVTPQYRNCRSHLRLKKAKTYLIRDKEETWLACFCNQPLIPPSQLQIGPDARTDSILIWQRYREL